MRDISFQDFLLLRGLKSLLEDALGWCCGDHSSELLRLGVESSSSRAPRGTR
jgi:hypothetical protein